MEFAEKQERVLRIVVIEKSLTAESSQGGELLMRGVAETLVQARRGRWWCKISPAQMERRRYPNSICERAGFAWKVMEAEFYVSYSSACIIITSGLP